jgi:hypothetical protein
MTRVTKQYKAEQLYRLSSRLADLNDQKLKIQEGVVQLLLSSSKTDDKINGVIARISQVEELECVDPPLNEGARGVRLVWRGAGRFTVLDEDYNVLEFRAMSTPFILSSAVVSYARGLEQPLDVRAFEEVAETNGYRRHDWLNN